MVTRISSILFALALVVFMSAGTASAADDVSNSRHNLSDTGIWNTTTDTTRICVFCHTPHGGHDGEESPPLWNKNLDTSVSYETHSMMNEATSGGASGVGGTTLACLQCHDGTQALDTMINAPGSGGWSGDLAGATQGYSFKEFTYFGRGAGTGEVSYLGTDLRNDHPVSIAFGKGSCFGVGMALDCSNADPEFNMPTGPYTAMHGGKARFTSAINSIKVTGRPVGNFSGMVVTKANALGATTVMTVECASCHNPHIGTNESEMFLRIAGNDDSAICLTCHIK